MKYKIIINKKLSIDDCSVCCFSRDGFCKLCTILNELKQSRPIIMCYDYRHAYFVELIELSNNIKVL